MKKHNFNAGPSILPREVIEDTAKAVLDFENDGLSILDFGVVYNGYLLTLADGYVLVFYF
mgnify:CR=1 FL=1